MEHDTLPPSMIARFLEEISWEKAVKYRRGGFLGTPWHRRSGHSWRHSHAVIPAPMLLSSELGNRR
ncbi:hypothetical protein [Arthrobacter burdickii]|uniref:Uncharacterized protein n=1 Tax=Arthrobacter burdickii TaxID=3035920 RepID=A0ABT8K4G6_9MICC|nr:hypothetical protein [Arthrobacter burdickii]MDN4612338.1 hypothetical protein [Arthrobacter burdickii]